MRAGCCTDHEVYACKIENISRLKAWIVENRLNLKDICYCERTSILIMKIALRMRQILAPALRMTGLCKDATDSDDQG